MVNRDETGREIVMFNETGKQYFVEWIEPKNMNRRGWGDINTSTKKIEGSYGSKYKGSVREDESMITKENGFDEIVLIRGSYMTEIERREKEYLKTLK